MEDLKSKTKKSLLWNAVDKVGMQVVALIVGIYTVRHLSSEDMGLIGALALFVAIGSLFVDGGFTTTLIRRERNTDGEYSAAFFFVLFVGIIIYVCLFFLADWLADWFGMPQLVWLSRFMFLVFILNALGVVPTAILMRSMNFKLLSVANMTGVCISGAVAVWMAYRNMGYWVLAVQQVGIVAIKVLMLWILNPKRWTTLKADFAVLPELIKFGGPLMLASCITQVGRNIQNVFIGKLCSVSILGNYYTAKKYEYIPESVVTQIVSQVSVPMLTQVRDDAERQMRVFQKMMRLCAMLTFAVMTGIAVIYDDFVRIALTEKWLPTTPYYILLTIPGIFAPFMSLMMNFMVVNGKNIYSPILESVKVCLVMLPLLALLADAETYKGRWIIERLGGEPRIMAMLLLSIISWAGCMVVCVCVMRWKWGYGFVSFIKDTGVFALAGVMMAVACITVGAYIDGTVQRMAAKVAIGAVVYLLTLRISGSDVYMEARLTMLEKFRKNKKQ